MDFDVFFLAVIVAASIGLSINAATWPLMMAYAGAAILYLGLLFSYALH